MRLWFALMSFIVLIFLIVCCNIPEELKKMDDDFEKRKESLDKTGAEPDLFRTGHARSADSGEGRINVN